MPEPNKYLIELHKIVVDWLKFAEAKNAALLTGNLVIIFGVSRLGIFREATELSPAWWYFLSVIIFCGLSALICLLSIVPQIEIPWISYMGKGVKHDNLVFYGAVARHSPETYQRALEKSLDVKLNILEQDFAGQIVVNSKIACRKYKTFKLSAWLTLSGFLTPLLGGVLILFREK